MGCGTVSCRTVAGFFFFGLEALPSGWAATAGHTAATSIDAKQASTEIKATARSQLMRFSVVFIIVARIHVNHHAPQSPSAAVQHRIRQEARTPHNGGSRSCHPGAR